MRQKVIRHFKVWNKWRKRSVNSKLYKFLVLIGVRRSPTMAFVLTDEEEQEIIDAMQMGINKGG